ncbi:MAG TPA: hypothetical protein VII13_21370 [Vicinamibacteria bacterium]|jgi:hypothetical protein
MFNGKILTMLALAAVASACGGAPQETAPPPTTAAGAATSSATAAGVPATGTASIAGKIKFEGAEPAGEKVRVAADAKCAAMHPQGLEKKAVEVKDGGLAHAFVYIKSGVTGSYPVPTEPVLLDQKGCMYDPPVMAVRTGQPIKIRNSDDTLHNIHPRPTINDEFNFGQARKGMEETRSFSKEEVMIPVGCDVHPWMRSYISVVGHPFFAVSDDGGSYEIKNVPAGEYEIEVYHGKLKGQVQKVTVKEGEKAALDFTFKG